MPQWLKNRIFIRAGQPSGCEPQAEYIVTTHEDSPRSRLNRAAGSPLVKNLSSPHWFANQSCNQLEEQEAWRGVSGCEASPMKISEDHMWACFLRCRRGYCRGPTKWPTFLRPERERERGGRWGAEKGGGRGASHGGASPMKASEEQDHM